MTNQHAQLLHPTLVSYKLCPYVQRAAIAMLEKEVQFNRIDIDLANKPQWFLEISPLGKTPVLMPCGRDRPQMAIFESAVICEFLDEVITPRMHPEDPFARAQHRAWIEVASATLGRIAALYTARDEETFRDQRVQLVRMFEHLEQRLNNGPWFSGARFSLVDAAFAPAFRYFQTISRWVDLGIFESLDRVHGYQQRLAERPSVMAAVGPDYGTLLREFIVRKNGYLGRLLAGTADEPA